MEGVGLGLARNIVQRYALETGSEQGFGIGEKVAHDCVDLDDVACRHQSTGCQRHPNVVACVAASSALAACSSTFDEAQPRNAQTPPGFGSASISVTRMPRSAAGNAAT
jgi:hypothetical protein